MEKREIKLKWIEPDKWHHRATFELLEDYTSPAGEVIPAGYSTDGASIPLGLRNLVSPVGIVFSAAIVHDYRLDIMHDSWADALDYFKKELDVLVEEGKISKFRRFFVLKAVKFHGFVARKP